MRLLGLPYGSSSLSKVTPQYAPAPLNKVGLSQTVVRNFISEKPNSTLGKIFKSPQSNNFSFSGLLQLKPLLVNPKRSVTKFSLSGKRKSVKVVLQKFYRLHWGCWIRTKCGREKRRYKKSANRRRRLQYHVFCNGRQNYLLDRMVTKYWRKPRFYVDDPYEPYHTREEFPTARMKPYQPYL